MVKKLIRKGKSNDFDSSLNELLANKEFREFIIAIGYV